MVCSSRLQYVEMVDGSYEEEWDLYGSFIWAKKKFKIRVIELGAKFLIMRLCYYGKEKEIFVKDESFRKILTFPLYQGRNYYTVDISRTARLLLEFELNRVIPWKGTVVNWA